jgi:O-acetyl-ADP-ribose deacetylase (regulator of RNase III)
MGNYRELNGDLVELAKVGEFNVVVHGCNCFNTMGSGIAVKFAEVFGADRFEKEHFKYRGDINKLGTIDYEILFMSEWDDKFVRDTGGAGIKESVIVVNAYTQYTYGKGKHLDYEALRLCLRKINKQFEGYHVGLPKIGSDRAGGNWDIIKSIIKDELKDVDVTVVIYDKG